MTLCPDLLRLVSVFTCVQCDSCSVSLISQKGPNLFDKLYGHSNHGVVELIMTIIDITVFSSHFQKRIISLSSEIMIN